MRLHEFQAKALFKSYDLPVPLGVVVESSKGTTKALAKIKTRPCVVKAQVLAGGRGKAGGVRLTKTTAEARAAIAALLGSRLVTKQTGGAGELVRRVLVEQAFTLQHEYYVGLVIDRSRETPVLLASREGGMEIEELAARAPEAILKEPLDVTRGLQAFQARKIIYALGLTDPKLVEQGVQLLRNLARLGLDLGASLVEINPLALTKERGLVAIDAKLTLDDSALPRHPELAALSDPRDGSPLEARARKVGIHYVGLDGTIGCMVNGAGLAMATMDIIKLHGGEPANFLDVGGGANVEQVREAFTLILGDAKVRAVLINIFGGIMQCDVIAQGILEAAKMVKPRVPLVVRLEGTRVQEGRTLLAASKLAIRSATTMEDAAKQVVAAAQEAR
ncbi:MAG: succinate--CoA ligase subunit beta [Omnitrophica WOR_2 bacterium RIFCSPHIGHO2_02_FULL_68_15]|nr:MAG: succinate--CoA ligase subunit beta [Omnitrophica WOR_2 bacterium RIFCSPHIGHO2_02_FULL_68_15]